MQHTQLMLYQKFYHFQMGTIEKLMNEYKELEPYKFLLENILKKNHVLNKQKKNYWLSASDCLDAPSAIHTI